MAEKPSPANVRVGPTGWSVRVVISLLTRRGRRARLSGQAQNGNSGLTFLFLFIDPRWKEDPQEDEINGKEWCCYPAKEKKNEYP